MQATIRQLVPEDAKAYVALRREMLVASSHAFLASPGSDMGSDPFEVQKRLAGAPENVTFGAFAPGLVGAVGMFRERHAKAAHKVQIWGMYVQPALRKQGLGRKLLEAAIEHARGLAGVSQVNLCVSSAAPGAQRLYESVGFEAWGTEPRAMRDQGRLLDEVHMVLFLDGR